MKRRSKVDRRNARARQRARKDIKEWLHQTNRASNQAREVMAERWRDLHRLQQRSMNWAQRLLQERA